MTTLEEDLLDVCLKRWWTWGFSLVPGNVRGRQGGELAVERTQSQPFD